MAVKRIVVNTSTPDIETSRIFHHDILGLEILMDMGWIRTYGNDNSMQVQMSFMTTGGSGTVVPEISIEVDDVDRVYQQMNKSGFEILYGPVNEPWEVRRFFVKDPFGKTVNILQHIIK